MKKFFAWVLRLACFAIIGFAVYTLVGCLMHINDDYSSWTVMGDTEVETFESGDAPAEAAVAAASEAVDENPTVLVYSDGIITANRPYATVTAAFGSIVNSVVADLKWYVNDELYAEESQRMLVEGSTVSCDVKMDVKTAKEPTAFVRLEVLFDDKSVTGETEITLDLPDAEGENVVIRTEEIPVTIKRNTDVYTDSTLQQVISETKKGETGLFLAYESDNNGLSCLQLLFEDGTTGWVDADDAEISEDDCTVDEDYSDEVKTQFVNSMKYDSQTSYMVWVSLYTQKVNVFSGYEGNWELIKSFDCSTGANTTPTTTGVFHYSVMKDKWDLGKTYVEPVLIFNGGEAFTSRPYDTETKKIADETMGSPASGGSVRMMEDDIAWMAENLPLATLVVVY